MMSPINESYQYSAVDSGGEINKQAPRTQKTSQLSTTYHRLVTDGWAVEIFAASVGVALIIGTWVLLHRYDGREVPNLGSALGNNITLNTIVSILLGIAVPSLLLAVSESISQLKWIWYRNRNRCLKDLDTFDKASRGATGSASFLYKVHFKSPATIGAIFMIFQIAVSPLAQNALLYPTVRVPNEGSLGASTSRMRRFYAANQLLCVADLDGTNAVYDYLPLSMKGAIQSGLFYQNGTVSSLSPSCPTGNCTFDPFYTLAIEMQMANVTSSLVFSNRTHIDQSGTYVIQSFTLPGGFNLTIDSREVSQQLNYGSITTPMQTLSSSFFNFNKSIAFANVSAPISDNYFIYVDRVAPKNENDFSHARAIEFTFYWTLQKLSMVVENGIPRTEVLESNATIAVDSASNLTAWPDWTNQADIYTIDTNLHQAMQVYLQKNLFGNVTMGVGVILGYANSDITQALFSPFVSATLVNDNDAFAALETTLKNMAMSMTNQFRISDGNEQISGIAWSTQTVVQVQFAYLWAPTAFAIACVLFLLGTMGYQYSTSGGTEAWKSSSIPVLLALSPDAQRALGAMKKPSELQAITDATSARLQRDGASTDTGGDEWTLRVNPGGTRSKGNESELELTSG